MARSTRITLFVTTIAVAAAICGAVIWSIRLPFPGWWPLVTLVFVATLLETLNTQLRLAAKGSTSFIMHMSAALLFGAWWGAVVAAVSTFFGEVFRSNPTIKLVFNVSQRILAVSLASIIYQGLG